MALDWVSSIIQIVLVNAVLSGDNAMVIALAAHRLPAAQRRQAMLWGSGLAIVMRLLLTSPCRSWRCDGPGTDSTVRSQRHHSQVMIAGNQTAWQVRGGFGNL